MPPMSWRCVAFPVMVVMAVACGPRSGAQGPEEGPPPDAEAASVDVFEPVPRQVQVQAGPGQAPGQWVIADDNAYYSHTLRGHFRAQWMFINQRGRRVTFWGARILSLDIDSPLRDLGLSPGDVITRLDGISIARNMLRENGGPWQLVQMERHFGRTEVRYIHPGTNRVYVGDIMLDGHWPDDPNPIPP
jgi:hypothetical protein